MRNRRVTQANIGEAVKSEAELQRLWVNYRGHLLGGPMGLTPSTRGEVDERLRQAWPVLLKYWRVKKAASVLDRLDRAFSRHARKHADELATRDAPEDDEGFGLPDEDDVEVTIAADDSLIDQAFPDPDDGVVSPSPPAATSPCAGFTGRWSTEWGEMRLTNGSGTYDWRGGTVSGSVSGNVLEGSWSQTDGQHGKMRFELDPATGNFNGTWTNEAFAGGGGWTGSCRGS